MVAGGVDGAMTAVDVVGDESDMDGLAAAAIAAAAAARRASSAMVTGELGELSA